jgi:hypothetical protein
MKLPYAFEYNGDLITDFEPRAMTGTDIANTKKKAQSSSSCNIMRTMAEGAIESLNGNTDRKYIKNAIQFLPFQSLNFVLIFSGAKTKGLESAEGTYICPRCKTERFYGKTEDDDLSDNLEDLIGESAPDTIISFTLPAPVEITRGDTGAALASMSEFTMRYPTISDYIDGEQKYAKDDIRAMCATYASALLTVNGEEVDRAYRNKFGDKLFLAMNIHILNELSKLLNKYAFGKKLERYCFNCQHEYKADLDIGNFFDLGQ